MIDFAEIPQEQVIARGQYSIVRQARDDKIKELRVLCEENNSASAAVLRDIQGALDVSRHLDFLRKNMTLMAECAADVEATQRQLEMIRPIAFP